MKIAMCFGLGVCAAAFSGEFFAAQAQQPPPQSPNMTYFMTGVGPGKGGDLGSIEGADRHCQELAQRAGAGNKTWRAYLNTQATEGKPASNAHDRIGHGPWQNFKGEIVAQNIDDLHSDNNKLGSQTSLTERGAMIPGLATHPTVTTFSPDLSQMAALSRLAKIGPATTGPAAPKDRRWSGTSTGGACAMMQRHGRGIHRIPRVGRTAAAARPICAARAAMDYSIASLPIR
jgi:hypothetical protein